MTAQSLKPWMMLTLMLLTDSVAAAPSPTDYREAFIAFFPLYEMARLRHLALEDPATARRGEVNRLNHRQRLLDHTARNVTAPNNDTLYSSARLDLRLGPLLVVTPKIERRYYSLQFMNMHTDNVAILGQRGDGAGPLRVAVVGPGWQGTVPAHTQLVRSDTNDMWLLIRTVVEGPSDLPAAVALQNAMNITSPQPASAYPAQTVRPSKDAGPALFLAVVNEMLQRNPPSAAMATRATAAAELGVGRGAKPWAELPAAVREAWTTLWPTLNAELQDPANLRTREVAGWEFPPPEVGQWGDNLLLRATVALRGIAALDLEETLYLSTFVDIAGQPLDGRARYRIRLPTGGLPVRGFWSITMYEVMPDGRFFLADNPIGRYSIGDRTPGLVRGADGTLELLVQPDPPPDIANWLPSPRTTFRLTLRAYLPEATLVQGQAPLPRVERSGSN